MRTLVIGPDGDKQRVLLEALARRGHEVTLVEDVGRGPSPEDLEHCPLVIVDVASLGDQGVDVCRRLREASSGQACTILAVADAGEPDHLTALLAAGADDCLVGPIDGDLLDARLTIAEYRRDRAGRLLQPTKAQEAADRALREVEAKLEGLLQNVPESVSIVDHEGIIKYINREYPGLPIEDILGTSCFSYASPTHQKQVRQALQLALKTGEPQRFASTSRGGSRYEACFVPLADKGAMSEVMVIATDVTEQMEAVDQCRESQSRYRLIADNVTDMIWTGMFEGVDGLPDLDEGAAEQVAEQLLRQWRFTYMSPSVQRLLGYKPEEATALKLDAMFTRESYQATAHLLAEELIREHQGSSDPRRQRTLEIQHLANDGSIRWCEVTMTFLRDENGRITGTLGVTRDISERRDAERALRESEAMLRNLLENIPDMVLMFNLAGVIQYVNHRTARVPASEVIGREVYRFIRPEDREAHRAVIRQAIETGMTQKTEVIDFLGVCWSSRFVPIVEDGEVQNLMVIGTDITEGKKAREAVQREQRLLRQLLELHERDRELLAFELHDGFTQQLTGAILNLEAVSEEVQAAPERVRESVREGTRLLRESIEEARRLVRGLHPPVLEEFGIVPAIEHLAHEYQVPAGPKMEFISKGRFERLARPLESAIFRIVQESLTNARQHSQTERVRLELTRADDDVRIEVRDWGVGFDPDSVDRRHFGLRGIRERARLFGGRADIESAPGHGTCVRVALPVVPDSRSETD